MIRHRTLRELARYYLAKLEDPAPDFPTLYRARLRGDSADDPTGALLGLAETGAARDSTLVLPFVSHDRVRVRRAAVRALGRLAAEEHLSLFRQLLREGPPGLAKEAHDAMLPLVVKVGADLLWSDFTAARAPVNRGHLITLMDQLLRWDRLILLLKVMAVGEDQRSRGRACSSAAG